MRAAKLAVWTGVVACLVGALVSWLSYRADRAMFAAKVAELAPPDRPADERALTLLHFVYGHHGFKKNQGMYLLPQLGPPASAVYESGGDCTDKSRLLAAMLREIDVSSTLAMCFDHAGVPTHTVVDATLPDGSHMLLDPIWDLHFPRAEPGQYYSLIDLRRRPQLLFERLEVVTASAAPGAKILRYNRAHDIYDHATTLNWDKSAVTRWVRDTFFGDLGDLVHAVPRPTILEEPKLFMAVAFVGAAGGLAAFGLILGWTLRAWSRRRSSDRGAAAPSAL